MLRIYKVSEASARPSRLAIDEAARELRAGSLALIPTETVYGIGVSVRACVDTMHAAPTRAQADRKASAHAATRGRAAASCALAHGGEDAASIEDAAPIEVNGQLPPAPSTGYGRIFTLKQRELTQTVPWLVDGPAALDRYGVSVAPELRVLAERFWPGALTIVVPAAPSVPAFMCAADGTVALRASASPVVQELVRACGSPLAVTSANTHGEPAPVAFSEVEPRVLGRGRVWPSTREPPRAATPRRSLPCAPARCASCARARFRPSASRRRSTLLHIQPRTEATMVLSL